MRKMTLTASICLLAGGLGLGFTGPALAQEISHDLEPLVEHVTSYRFLANGIRASEAGNTGLAHDNYIRAARDANKIAQFKLGLMYLEGYRGPGDPEQAWAWMELSAERHYPQFREIADQLWMTFDEHEQTTARRILEEELRPTFGDEAAIPRVAAEMRRSYRNQTGTRVGFGGSSLRVVDNSTLAGSAMQGGQGGMLSAITFRDGSNFYVADRWDFEQIVAAETVIFRSLGTVSIRDEVDN